MVRLQTLDLRIGVRVPASQPMLPYDLLEILALGSTPTMGASSDPGSPKLARIREHPLAFTQSAGAVRSSPRRRPSSLCRSGRE